MRSTLRLLVLVAAAGALLGAAGGFQEKARAMPDVRLMTLDPGHFHAALVQKEMYPGVAARVDVFAPLGPDLLEHLNRVASFNRRSERPTAWELEVHTSADFFARMLRERPGNVVILSGRNRVKIDQIVASIKAGLHVLADKPWILESEDLPKIESRARRRGREGPCRLRHHDGALRDHVDDPARARQRSRRPSARSSRAPKRIPAVYMESVHHLMKVVAGAPNIRPPWFFDTAEQGEGASDIGTHLVDLVQWTLFPDQAIDYRADIRVLAAQRWPTGFPKTTSGA